MNAQSDEYAGHLRGTVATLELNVDADMKPTANPTERMGLSKGQAMKFSIPSGSKVLSGYTIKRGIGRGGFGEVYYGLSDAGKEVALKLLQRNWDVEIRGVSQCLNLKHHNLIALYDIRQDENDDHWVVMEYVQGDSLEDVLHRHQKGLPPEEVIKWFRGIAAGVAYLHDNGIVHRDLKPGNVFSDSGLVKLGDYGLAKFISCSRRSGQTESVGTVHYMAPEVANGRYGKEIDIYALGVILFELITGRVPFEGESVGEVLMKHLTADPDLSALAEPFRSVVARALVKDPDARISSVAEMLELLPEADDDQSHFEARVNTEIPVEAELEAELVERSGSAQETPYAAERVGVPTDGQSAENKTTNDSDFDENGEPIFETIRAGCRKFFDWYHSDDVNGLARAAILAGAVLLVVFNFAWLIPIATSLLVFYGIYWIVWTIFLEPDSSSELSGDSASAAPPQTAPPQTAPPQSAPPQTAPPFVVRPVVVPVAEDPMSLSRRERREQRRSRVLSARVLKSNREKIVELLGAMAIGAVVAAVVALLLGMAFGYMGTNSNTLGSSRKLFLPIENGLLMWMIWVSIGGTWASLIIGKLWEDTDGEQALRRFIMLVVGLGIGFAAFLFDSAFPAMQPIDQWNITPLLNNHFSSAEASGLGSRLSLALPTYLIYFGLLLLIVPFWQLADPERIHRFSFWQTVVCVLWAILISWVWSFPQPWGAMIAATMAIAIQIASRCAPRRGYSTGSLA